MAFEPFNEMFVPLGTTPEGYQYGTDARILYDKDYETGDITSNILVSKEEVCFYFAAPLEDGSMEIIDVVYHFDGNNYSHLNEKRLGDIVKLEKKESNQFSWHSYYNQTKFDSFIYKAKEIKRFEKDAQNQGWEAKEGERKNYIQSEYFVCHEQMLKSESCAAQIREVAEFALGFKEVQELLFKLSKAYSEGGRAYLASVITAPKIRKDKLEKMYPTPIAQPLPKSKEYNGKKKQKDKCDIHVVCEDYAKIISHGVRLDSSPITYDKVMWTLKIKNISKYSTAFRIKVEVYDNEGFKLTDRTISTRRLEAGETADVGDYCLIDKGLWPTVKLFDFVIKLD